MKKIRLETKIKRILFSTLVPMAALMVLLLVIVSGYVSQYDRLLENLAISSEFNLHFKDDVDLGMYSICLLYTSPSPRDRTRSRMPSSA